MAYTVFLIHIYLHKDVQGHNKYTQINGIMNENAHHEQYTQ